MKKFLENNAGLVMFAVGAILSAILTYCLLLSMLKEAMIYSFDYSWMQFQTMNPSECNNIPSGIMIERYKRGRIQFSEITSQKYSIKTCNINEFQTNENYNQIVDKKVTSMMGYRNWQSIDTGGLKGKYHSGVDIGMTIGTLIKPFVKGYVFKTGYNPGGFGYYIILQSGAEKYLYGHLKKILVKKGQEVDINTVIALSGNTGNSRGGHLHYQVYDPIPVEEF